MPKLPPFEPVVPLGWRLLEVTVGALVFGGLGALFLYALLQVE